MKLISMTAFVLNQKQSESFNEKTFINEALISLEKIRNYANFLRQHLNIGMFVTCDENGNVLQEPKNTNYQVDVNAKCSGWKYLYDSNDKLIGYYDDRKWKEDFVKYKQSKEKVLFEGIEFRKNGGVNFLTINEDTFAFHDFNIKFKYLTIEFLVQYNLELTESAIKQIEL